MLGVLHREYVQADTDIPPLETIIESSVFKHLKPKERKRQEIVNGKMKNYVVVKERFRTSAHGENARAQSQNHAPTLL